MSVSSSEQAVGDLAAARPSGADVRWVPLRWLDRLNEALLFLLAVVLGALACLAIWQVVARYGLRAPLSWSEEVIRFTMIWCVFLGAGIVVRKGMLVAVEAVYIFAPPRLARWIGGFALLVSAAFWIVLIVYGWAIAGRVAGLMSGSLELPMSFVYAGIPVGAALALVNTIAVAIDPPRPVITQAAS